MMEVILIIGVRVLMQETFKDVNGNVVTFTTKKGAFLKEPQHVLVICRYNDQWLLTKHPQRGLEFPGGKREGKELIQETAIREVFEETGGIVSKLLFIGEYEVKLETESFIKSVFFASVDRLENKKDFLETEGPVLLQSLPSDFSGKEFSFIMKDRVVELSLNEIKNIMEL